MISWDSDLSVNVEEIDIQHKELIKMLNELNDAMKVGKSKEMIGNILERMVSYMHNHFALEEKYFDQFGFPESTSHKLEHENFTVKVSEFMKRYSSGQLALSIDVMNFLIDWLVNHIKGTDKRYSRFFNEHGLR